MEKLRNENDSKNFTKLNRGRFKGAKFRKYELFSL